MNSKELLISLEFDRRQYRAEEQQLLRYTITNESENSISVLKWHTPLEGFNSNMFRIKKGRRLAVYLGRTVKRGIPTQKDYLTIEPRDSVSVEFDIVEYYDISKAGDYSVEFRPTLLDYGPEEPKDLAAKGKLIPKTVRSNVVSFRLLENREPRQLKGVAKEWIAKLDKALAKRPPTFTSCTSNEQNIVDNALTEAERIASKACHDLKCTKGSERKIARRYKQWSGIYASSRYNKVTSNFDEILDALANRTITFDCSCNENYYAYVYPTRPYEIYLCNVFWTRPLTGTDSQAGTIVHEISHFDVVAGTEDHVYGQTGCRNLAVNDPSEAIENADSHEYFAENTPTLSMGMCESRYALWLLGL